MTWENEIMVLETSRRLGQLSEATPRINDMGSVNAFADARIEAAGSVRGADEVGHDLFEIERDDGPPPLRRLYLRFSRPEKNDFNIEIGVFGYVDPYNVGNPHPKARHHFSAEESAAIEGLIRSYFLSNPPIYAQRHLVPGFLGGVTFRPNWILQE
jgi:hypothetical protein